MANGNKLALTMIVSGDEKPESLQRCLNSINSFVDGIFIVITTPDNNNLEAVANRYGANVEVLPHKFHEDINPQEIKWIKEYLGKDPKLSRGDKIFQFDKARNYIMEMVPKEFDWILWLDTDDIFRGGDKLKHIINQCNKGKVDAVFLNYIYQAVIKDGKIESVLIEHLRERLIRNGLYEWLGSIHETLMEKKPTRKATNEECDVLHLSNNERMENALVRNIRALEHSIYLTKGKDPRPIYYLGKALYDNARFEDREGNYKAALKLFNVYINGSKEYDYNNKSGWDEERSQCWEYMMEIYRTFGEHNNSIKCGMNALIEYPKSPSIFINIAFSYLLLDKPEMALFWIKQGANIPMPNTTLIKNPRDIAARTLEIIYLASVKTSKLDEAWAAAQKLFKMFPDNEEMSNRVKFTQGLRQERELTKMFLEVSKYLNESGEKNKMQALMEATPSIINNNPFIADLRKKVIPPRVWKEDEITIFCGPGFTHWSPKILEKPGLNFVGGSEEAVIYMSKELAKQGWKVTVYGDPGEDVGEHDGVMWLPSYRFNIEDTFNIFIGWRNVRLFDSDIKSKKSYLWCHDVQNQLEYTPERLSRISKIFCLSNFHRSNISDVPDDKIIVTGNGINT